MTARGLTVGELRARLAEFPDYYPVVVETIVGGDLGTDVVDLIDVRATGQHVPFVELIPDPADNYGTRDLIDEALAARERIAEAAS